MNKDGWVWHFRATSKVFPFVLKIFHTAGCGRPSRLYDELATLGLDCGPRRLPGSKDQGEGEL